MGKCQQTCGLCGGSSYYNTYTPSFSAGTYNYGFWSAPPTETVGAVAAAGPSAGVGAAPGDADTTVASEPQQEHSPSTEGEDLETPQQDESSGSSPPPAPAAGAASTD